MIEKEIEKKGEIWEKLPHLGALGAAEAGALDAGLGRCRALQVGEGHHLEQGQEAAPILRPSKESERHFG